MHADIQRLVELQAVDTRLSELRSRLAGFPQQLAEIDHRLAQKKQEIAAAKEELTKSLKDRKTYEMDVDSWKEKARKYRDQSSAVKTNEAYKALLHEIQHAEGEVAQAEDRLLERMVAGEEFERHVKAAEGELKAVEREAAAQREKIETERATLQKDLETKIAERKQELGTIPENLLAIYEHIAQHHRGIAVAEVRNEACSLCGVIIRPHVFQELRRDSNELYQCETCTRILYYIEPPPAADAAPADAKSAAASAHGSDE